ncbi:hypothetical protein [Bradyrhizobium sp. Cp5.3]|uniref:hypothetical protein n=1 Tax=Bradyrhizobium sp. Cp5.3 TaxID=443598 RepID=UPI00048642BA|nr:hypothetical protein [Bradyrhizobium sp. Cp5.3]
MLTVSGIRTVAKSRLSIITPNTLKVTQLSVLWVRQMTPFKIARIGGYLARASDPPAPPGNTVMWRELSRLTDAMDGGELVGN